MVPQTKNDQREKFIILIESQDCICDRYYNVKRIDAEAGGGHFSLVFTSTDKNLKDKTVVLKFLDPLLGDPYRIESFHRECKLLKQLNGQPNILPLLKEKTVFTIDLGKIDFNLFFYSSPLAKCSIKGYVYSDGNDLLLNMIYFREMCKAVQRIHNHKNSICHRDLKPENFLIFDKSNVCLSDFGTAKNLEGKSPSLMGYYKSPVGDRRYVAPELLCGLGFSKKHNYCADIYSLGAILFELFSKTIFGVVLHRDTNKVNSLISYCMAIPERNRIQAFDNFIDSFAEGKDIYSIGQYNSAISKSLLHKIDQLYKSMVCLNYKKRECNFRNIFIKIDICISLIKRDRASNKEKIRDMKKRGGLCYQTQVL